MEGLELISVLSSHPATYSAVVLALIWYRLGQGQKRMDDIDLKLGVLDRRMGSHETSCYKRNEDTVRARGEIKGDIRVIKQDVEDVKRRVAVLEGRA